MIHERAKMKLTLWPLAIAATILSLACTDGSPTAPAPSAASVAQEESPETARPSRPSTRVVPPRPTARTLAAGNWGSAQTSDLNNWLLTVTPSGATLRSECAEGVVEGTIRVDAAGRFEVVGTYQYQAGPSFLPRPARFVGVADSGTLTLTVILPESAQTFGPFTLRFGQAPRIGYCPIV
jgi:hypothetical protein